MKICVKILLEIEKEDSGVLCVNLLNIQNQLYKQETKTKETNKQTKGKTNMCRVLRQLDGIKAEELVRDFKLYTSLPVNLNGILKRYGIPTFPSDFKDMENFKHIRDKVSVKGEILGAVTVDGDDVKIFYKEGESRHRQKFTIAHELAHCCLNAQELMREGHIEFRTDIESLKDGQERQANIFAGELLIPRILIEAIYNKINIVDLTSISEIFDVSENVMKARLDYLGKAYYCNKS